MAASGRTDLMSDEIIHIKCHLCTQENRRKEAEKYCIECKDYFCTSCVGIHNKLASLKGHKILDKSDFNTLGPDGSLPSYPTQRCGQHPLEVVSMYCKDHDDVACGPCVALSHRSCGNILSISDNIDNLYQRSELKDLQQKLNTIKKKMEKIKRTNEVKIQQVKEGLNKEIQSIKAFRQELQALLDTLEQETIGVLQREFSKIEAALADDINKAESLVSSINEATSQLNNSEGNLAQEFVCVKSSQTLIVTGQKVETTHLTARDETVSFAADQTIKVFLGKMKTLGEISIKTNQPHTLGTVSINSNQPQTFIPKDGLYTVKQTREIDVKVDSDKSVCDILGSCITDDGLLLLADYNNNKLKLIDMTKEQVKDNLDLKAAPRGVCMVSKTEVAVSLDNQSFQFISLGEKMTVTQTIKMNHKCFGLASKDGKLFISDLNKAVYIYNMTGKHLLSITTDSSGNNIFKNSWHIATSTSEDRVFVADLYNGVVVLDSQGNYISTQKDTNDSGYRGVCTDGRNIFVSNYLPGNIIQFGHFYKVLGTVGTVNYPRSLCFDLLKMRLIATQANNKIVVLDLE